MTIKIHHNTAKKAAAHKIVLTVVEGEVVASTRDGVKLASGLVGNKVLEDAIAKLGAPIVAARAAAKAKTTKKKVAVQVRGKSVDQEMEFDEDGEPVEGDDEDAPEGKSMIKSKYKKIYKPFKMTNGDDLNVLLAEHLKYKDEDGQMRVNPAKLVKFAKANDCWVDGYKNLNIGQQRLNVGNRLRAKIKKGWAVLW